MEVAQAGQEDSERQAMKGRVFREEPAKAEKQAGLAALKRHSGLWRATLVKHSGIFFGQAYHRCDGFSDRLWVKGAQVEMH